MRMKNRNLYKPFSVTLSIAFLAVMVGILVVLVKSVQTKQIYTKKAATCVSRPYCLDHAPKCYIAAPKEGWCPLAETPQPTQASNGATCLQCLEDGTNILCSDNKTGNRLCSSRALSADQYSCTRCVNPRLTCIPRPSCADDPLHPCVAAGAAQFCAPIQK